MEKSECCNAQQQKAHGRNQNRQYSRRDPLIPDHPGRTDRMGLPQITEEDIVSPPEGFNIRDYSEKIFWMYDGYEEQVTLRCKHHMMENIIDYFGQDVVPRNITEDTFDVTVASISIAASTVMTAATRTAACHFTCFTFITFPLFS